MNIKDPSHELALELPRFAVQCNAAVRQALEETLGRERREARAGNAIGELQERASKDYGRMIDELPL